MKTNFKGYLLKVGDRIFPNRFISFDTWDSSPDRRTDEDSYTDGNGQLVRNILPHTRSTLTFETVDELHLADKIELQSFFNRDDTTLSYWNDEINDYISGRFYIADPNFLIKSVDEETCDIIYDKIKLELIEY